MPSDSVARVYADALFGIGREHSNARELGQELEQILAIVQGEKEVFLFLTSPVIERGVKIETLRAALGGRVNDTVVDFLCLLIEKRRFAHLPRIVEAYGALVDEHVGRVRVTMSTAVPLTESLQEEIRSELVAHLGREVVLTPEVDPEILGGAIVTMGDKVYDGSLSGRLDRFRRQVIRSRGYEDQG
jgi:F-type H+-transporting ATPase subunit delta